MPILSSSSRNKLVWNVRSDTTSVVVSYLLDTARRYFSLPLIVIYDVLIKAQDLFQE